MRMMTALAAGAAALSMTAQSAQAAGLIDISDLLTVTAYERTGGSSPTAWTFAASGTQLANRLDPLDVSHRDFNGIGVESYDIFFSDSHGHQNQHGSWITIEGTCTEVTGCFNISGVSLGFGSQPALFATLLSRFVVGGGPEAFPATAINAVDGTSAAGDLSTHTTLGDTVSAGAPARMAITVGFEGISRSDSAVPEPATWALIIGGFGAAGAMLRRRRAAVAKA